MKRKPKQREFGFVNHGGKRRGAGRKPKGKRAGVSHKKRPVLDPRYPVMVTMRLAEALPSMRYDDSHKIVRDVVAEVSERPDFKVIVYSVQSNHLHLIVEARSEDALGRGMNALTTRVAKRLNKLWRRKGKVFPDRYHARILRTPRECRIALIYVLQNSRKHGSWRALMPDVYSSGPAFDGWSSPVVRGAVSSPSYAGTPHTWLLAVGWRRHGLIDLREVPVAA